MEGQGGRFGALPVARRERPEAVAREVEACATCADRFAATATAHAPRPITWTSPTARLMIASQAPGARAHASGLFFDDPSGDRLRDWLGLDRPRFYDREKVAIAPMAFCFPGYDAKGSDLPPPRICASLWRERLLATMPQIELIVLVGAYAQAWHLGPDRKRTLTETVASWRDHLPRYLPIPHPSWRNTAWLKRNPWFEAELVPEVRARVARLTA